MKVPKIIERIADRPLSEWMKDSLAIGSLALNGIVIARILQRHNERRKEEEHAK